MNIVFVLIMTLYHGGINTDLTFNTLQQCEAVAAIARKNGVEHAFCVFKCRACASSFIMWEDYIAYCRRQIQNAENVIESQNEKIKYFNKILQRGALWQYLRK